QYVLLHIRLSTCPFPHEIPLLKQLPMEKFQEIKIGSKPDDGVFGPCKPALRDALHRYFYYECNTDLLLGPDGNVFEY
ncbi:MAG: hypothetical protein AAF570_05055, partial [Bacteroidota bacterium]